MTTRLPFRTALLLPIFFSTICFAQPATPAKSGILTGQRLPRSTPEREGISSQAILDFLTATTQGKTEFHSFMLLRHGKVVAEGWWNPYAADIRHTMYSCSKSFTATAIGFAVSEHKLKVTDKVISFFPQDLPDTVSDYLSQLTVRDVLSMTDGQEPDPTGAVISRDSNWVKAFLALPIKYAPGSVFLYNSLGTYMLSAIVQKVTGQKVIDYLKPRLFDPLGIQGIDWEVDPRGINTGGWGLRLKTEDMAKFGQLFLNKGKWKGKQLLPASWVEEASSTKIIQHPGYTQEKRDSSDWEQGYCYQMWRCRYNAYRGDGAFGQFIVIMPDQDAVLAMTAETPSMQEEINMAWKHLLPAMQKDPLPQDGVTQQALARRLKALTLPVPKDSVAVSNNRAFEKSFDFEKNDRGFKSVAFRFNGDKCVLTVTTDTGTFAMDFAKSKWAPGMTARKGPSLTGAAKASLAGLPPFKIRGAYRWKDEATMELSLRYIESPHTEKFTCHLNGNRLEMDMENSFDYGKRKTSLVATAL